MCSWNIEELRSLCTDEQWNNTEVFINSLDAKFRKSNYHASKAQDIFRRLYEEEDVISTSDEKWMQAELETEAETEACVQVLNAMPDTLAQALNTLFLQGSVDEGRVSLKGIKKELEEQGIAQNIIDAIEELLDDDGFNYVRGFCNTIKHRRLIETEHRGEYGEGRRDEEGIVFKEFDANGQHYDAKWASDINIEINETIQNLINRIGEEVNAYLRGGR